MATIAGASHRGHPSHTQHKRRSKHKLKKGKVATKHSKHRKVDDMSLQELVAHIQSLLQACLKAGADLVDVVGYVNELFIGELKAMPVRDEAAITASLTQLFMDCMAGTSCSVEPVDAAAVAAETLIDDGVVDAFSAALRAANAAEGAAMLAGETGLAVLAEDADWHPCVVDKVLDDGASFMVTFTEYAKPQQVTRKQLVLTSELPNDDEDEDFGACGICGRDMPLTRHHVIPKLMHAKYKKLGHTAESLNSTVALICRACHSAVHRFADHATLAESYNTLEKLNAAEPIQKWAAYASSLKPISKADAALKLRTKK